MTSEHASIVLTTLDRSGVGMATRRLLALAPRDMVAACRDVVLELFQARRDVTRGLLIGWTGAVDAERLARAAPAIHGLDDEFLDHARSLFALTASLSWSGWGQGHMNLDATGSLIGRACAERASDLATELDAEPLVRAKARWLVAMHALFAEDLETARLHLVAASRLAEGEGAVDEVKLLRGYLMLVQSRGEPDDPEIGYEIERICMSFAADPATEEFAEQLRVARAALEELGAARPTATPRDSSTKMA